MYTRLDGILTNDEVQRLTVLLASATFDDGAATAGPAARGVKHNLQATGADTEQARRLLNDALMRSQTFRGVALPFRILPAIFSRYGVGMTYGDHTDNPIMGADVPVRTDLALTVFLSEPADYDGGELVIDVDRAAQRVKLPSGCGVVYPATSLHRVAPVTRGERVAAVTWVQSLVRDATQRDLLADLGTVLAALRASAPNARETLLVAKTRANLMRMWSEP